MLSRITFGTPTVNPVPIQLLRRHANIDHTFEDDLLLAYATAATEIAENACNRVFLPRVVNWVLSPDTRQSMYFSMAVTLQNFFNSYQRPWLHLPHSAISIASMSLGNWGGVDTVLAAGIDFDIDIASDPARIRLDDFSAFDPTIDHITITYTTGYQPTVPLPIQQAIMCISTRLRANKGDSEGGIWTEQINALLAPYVVTSFGASSSLYNA